MLVLRKIFVLLVIIAFSAGSLPISAHASGSGPKVESQKVPGNSHDCGHHAKADAEKVEHKAGHKTDSKSCCDKECKCSSGGCASVKAAIREAVDPVQAHVALVTFNELVQSANSTLEVDILRPPQA